MAIHRHLSRAPITEALIDLRVKLSPEMQDVAHLERIHEQIKEQFPERKSQYEQIFEFHAGPSPTEKSVRNHVGYRLTSGDGKRVIQATVKGFTFSRLKPYETWENLRAEAYEIWKLYEETVRPEAITRVATRFINQIEISMPMRDFSDYLTAAPIVPEKLPQGLASYYTRLVLLDPATGAVAIVTQAFEPGANPQVVPVILDIVVYKEKSFENQVDAWDTIDKLRPFKNLIFFESITDKTAELYQ